MARAHERRGDVRPSSADRAIRVGPDRGRRGARVPDPRRTAPARRAVGEADGGRRGIPPHPRRARLQRRRPRHPARSHHRRRRPRAPDQEPSRRVARIHPRRGADATAREPDQADRRPRAAPGSDDRGARLVLPLGSRRLRGRDGCDPRSPLHEAEPASARLVGGRCRRDRRDGLEPYLPARALAVGRRRRSGPRRRCRAPQLRGRPDPLDAMARRTISRPGRSRRVHRPARRRSACGRASRATRSG